MDKKVLEVTFDDTPVGLVEKLTAHQQKVLHRAFSIFIIDDKNKMLVQKRADNKYHSSGLLTNACCSHPIGDDIKSEALVRLKEELGIMCSLEFVDSFIYFAEFENGLAEYELDHIFLGHYDSSKNIPFNHDEVSEICWMPIEELTCDIKKHPDNYSKWFITALCKVLSYIEDNEKNSIMMRYATIAEKQLNQIKRKQIVKNTLFLMINVQNADMKLRQLKKSAPIQIQKKTGNLRQFHKKTIHIILLKKSMMCFVPIVAKFLKSLKRRPMMKNIH